MVAKYSIDWQADIIMIFPVVFSIFILFLLPDFNFTIDLRQFSFYGMQLVIFDVFMVRDCHYCYDFYFYLFVFIYGSTYLFLVLLVSLCGKIILSHE